MQGEAALLDFVPKDARRILDLGAGDGRLLALLRIDRPITPLLPLLPHFPFRGLPAISLTMKPRNGWQWQRWFWICLLWYGSPAPRRPLNLLILLPPSSCPAPCHNRC